MKDGTHSANLRKVGGSIMVAVPPSILDELRLGPGAKVGLVVESGRLIVQPQRKPRYSLKELLAQCDSRSPRSIQNREWLRDKPVGRELI